MLRRRSRATQDVLGVQDVAVRSESGRVGAVEHLSEAVIYRTGASAPAQADHSIASMRLDLAVEPPCVGYGTREVDHAVQQRGGVSLKGGVGAEGNA